MLDSATCPRCDREIVLTQDGKFTDHASEPLTSERCLNSGQSTTNEQLRGTCQGRGIRAGYWYGQATEGGYILTLGCEVNQEFWATVRLTKDDLTRMLQEMSHDD